MDKRIHFFVVLLLAVAVLVNFPSCKSCNKNAPVELPTADTTFANNPGPVVSPINLPHADTLLIPVLRSLLEDAFAASQKQDFQRLGSLIIYRGPDSLKYGYDVFDTRKSFDKKIVRMTSDVFNKWRKNTEATEYLRVFQIGDPNVEVVPVMEVIFVSKKSINRKFFIFQQFRDEWKIAEVTSYL